VRKLLFFITLFAGVWGCPPKPIPVPQPPIDVQNISICLPTVLATINDSCDGFFIKNSNISLACASCSNGGGCYDSVDAVYCAVNGNCLSDPRCVLIHDGVSSKRTPKKR
jgi:hypothetical protein